MNKRVFFALLLVLISVLAWIPASPLIELIINNDEVVLGRYSRGHFGGLLLLSLVSWTTAAVLFSTRKKPVGETVFAWVMVFLSTGLSGFVLIVGSGFLNKPRYVEQNISGVDQDTGMALSGIVRHRPPHERFDLVQKDEPEQLRSYPDAPPGYPQFPLVLTTDANGFRNQDALDHYDMLVIGDSFVAGSHVSDDQAWVDLLRRSQRQSIYNLGVSGTNPLVYLNNFVTLGRKFKPHTVMVMLYEGNDFRDAPPVPVAPSSADPANAGAANKVAPQESKANSIAFLAKSSPVTRGLARLTSEVLARIGSDNPVPGYAEAVGFMPLVMNTAAGRQYYSFDPKRLHYLVDGSEQEFAASSDWHNVRDVLDRFVLLSKKDGFRLIFVYAPSAPHVILPLVESQVPAQQLLNFMEMKKGVVTGVDADAYKQRVFGRLDASENVWRQWCRDSNVECISTTAALRHAVAAGKQVYYTYDQHWTPEGNAVTAGVVDAYLRMPH